MVKKVVGRLPRWDQRACHQDELKKRELGPDLFFEVEKWDKIPNPIQSSFCRACIIQRECLQWALDNDEKFGIWGDTTPFQREQMRRGIHRVRCVGCNSYDILMINEVTELCISCGLTWKL
jgi:WhiB family redox-sensing transcriptional regulator